MEGEGFEFGIMGFLIPVDDNGSGIWYHLWRNENSPLAPSIIMFPRSPRKPHHLPSPGSLNKHMHTPPPPLV